MLKQFLTLMVLSVISFSSAQNIEENLLLHYPFDGNSEDASGNEHHADEFEVIYVDDRFGNPESAIYFNGVNSYINFPNLPELKPDLPVSFAFWIRYDSNHYSDRELFNTSFEEDMSSGVFFNSQQSTGRFSVSFGDGTPSYTSNTRRSFTTNMSIQTGQWTNIVVVVESANNMKIFVNCRDFGGTYSGTGGPLYYSNTPGSLGRHDRELNSPANYFNGALDDFRYWDRALSMAEVQMVCSSSLNLESVSWDALIKLIPNPAKDFFEIVSPVSFEQIQIADITGKIIFKGEYSEKQNIAGLKSGVYMITLVSDEYVVKKKLIIR